MAAVTETEVPLLDPDPEVAEDLRKLRGLMEDRDIEGARAYVRELAEKWPASERVQHYARVLVPPVARSTGGRSLRSLERERAWIRSHAGEYPGCWVALWGDELIAADPDLANVLAVVRKTPGRTDALVHLQPGTPEPR